MSTTMIVPVAIAPDALAFVERVGQRQEFELMIDRANHFVPGLSSIEVALDEAIEDMPPGVILWAHRDDIGTDDDPTQRSWIEWMAATFPPEVCENLVMLPVYRASGRWIAAMSQPVKISDELILDARLTAQVAERSIAGRIEFWAQLGRAIEPLLEGSRALALRLAGAAVPLSERLASIDLAAGRQRVACSSGFGRRVGTDDADELVHQVRSGRKGDVNALR